ncbi:MAG: NADH-quinone oxidoreductase subunit C [Clostridia bacterium]|nr:NADH-quinone oxidoreductase subunit C [Clostridia bacterium]
MDEMIKEENILKEIKEHFTTDIESSEIRRKNRIWIDIPVSKLTELLKFLKDKGYYHLSTITGLDEGEKLGAIYHITDKSILINIRVRVYKNDPKIPSIISIYPSATSYERELYDLFGIIIEGLPAGRNYPLPEGFPQGVHPLRKEVKLDELNKMLDEKCKEEK